MQIIRKEVPSTDGVHTLRGVLYLPDGKPKGLLQIAHGMKEHIARYHDFMTAIAEAGFAVCGHDHLGHGKTAEGEGEYGYFSLDDGWRIVTRDIHSFGKAVAQEIGMQLPRILLGHSMGSFLSRAAVVMYPNYYDALIIMGTGGPNPASTAGLMLTRALIRKHGELHVSELASNLIFSSYNKRTGSDKEYAWLTRDEEKLAQHDSDPLCLFPFTVSAIHDLISVQKAVNQSEWFERVDRQLPILILSGEQDPVGAYGKGVKAVHNGLKQAGAIHVAMKLYPDMRHEILNEIGREVVYLDITEFMGAVCSGMFKIENGKHSASRRPSGLRKTNW